MDTKAELWHAGLRQGRAMKFRSLGSSMMPAIRPGDLVTIVPEDRCLVGDIVLWGVGEGMVLHRVLAKFPHRVITKGDAAPRLDLPLDPREIRGRAVRLERQGRVYSLESWPSRFLGLAFSLTLAWIPGLVAALAAVKRLGREKLGLEGSAAP